MSIAGERGGRKKQKDAREKKEGSHENGGRDIPDSEGGRVWSVMKRPHPTKGAAPTRPTRPTRYHVNHRMGTIAIKLATNRDA